MSRPEQQKLLFVHCIYYSAVKGIYKSSDLISTKQVLLLKACGSMHKAELLSDVISFLVAPA